MTAFVAFAIALWATVVLTGLSFLAMILELRWNSVPVKFPAPSLNAVRRVRESFEIIAAYRRFKEERGSPPILAWAMWFFGAGIVAVPLAALVYSAIWGF